MNLFLSIFYFILAFLAVPQAVDCIDSGRKVAGVILTIAAFSFGICAALGLNLWLMDMGL